MNKKKIIGIIVNSIFLICSSLWCWIAMDNSRNKINEIIKLNQGLKISDTFKIFFNFFKFDNTSNILLSTLAIVSIVINIYYNTYIILENYKKDENLKDYKKNCLAHPGSFGKIFSVTIGLIINILLTLICISLSTYIIPVSFILWKPALTIIFIDFSTQPRNLSQYIDDEYISNKPIVNDCFDPNSILEYPNKLVEVISNIFIKKKVSK